MAASWLRSAGPDAGQRDGIAPRSKEVFVSAALRGRGIAKALINALHDTARLPGRSLLLINARRAAPAEQLYKQLGYREFGVIPGYAIGPGGERWDSVCMYRELSLS